MDAAARDALDRAGRAPITIDITTTGRSSGEPRRIEIWMVKTGDDFVIGGTPRPRDWLANLQADPSLVVHLKDDVVADLPATAVEVTDAVRRREIWTHPITEWYRTQATVDELVDGSPTVVVTFS